MALETGAEAKDLAMEKIQLEPSTESLGAALWSIVVLANEFDIDLEGALREQIYALRHKIEAENL